MIRVLIALLLILQCNPVHADVFSDVEEPARATVPRYDPGNEALRSLVLPGWSQHRQGAPNAGWGYTAIAVTTFFFMIGTWDVPVIGSDEDNFGQVFAGVIYGMNAVVSAFDAYNRAADSNRENGWDLDAQARGEGFGIRLALVRVSF